MKFGSYAVACALLFASSCSSTSKQLPKYSNLLSLSKAGEQALQDGTLPKDGPIPADALILYAAKAGGKKNDSIEIQKALATALITVSDMQCESYMIEMIWDTNTISSFLGVSSLFLSGAAGVTTPVRSANLVSSVAAFANGARTELSNTVLNGKTPDIIYRAVMAVRAKERSRLVTTLNDQQLGDKAPGIVLAQLADYHTKCGLVVGLNALSQAVEQAQSEAKQTGEREAKETVKQLAPTPQPAPTQ